MVVSYRIDDGPSHDGTGNDSKGNNDGLAQCGETIELYVIARNDGGSTLTGVSAAMSESDAYVRILYNTAASYPNLKIGASGENPRDWDLRIDADTPNGHQFQFTLNGGAVARDPAWQSAGFSDLIKLAPYRSEAGQPAPGSGSSSSTPASTETGAALRPGRFAGRRLALCYRKTDTNPGRYLEAALLRAGVALEVYTDQVPWARLPSDRDFEDVLSHYYSGSSVDSLDDLSVPTEPLWVNLERNRSAVTLIAKKTGLGDPVDVVVTRGSDSWTVGVNGRIEIDWVSGTRKCDLEFRTSGGSLIEDAGVATCDMNIGWDGDADAPTRKIEIDGCEISDWNGKEPGNEGAYDSSRPCQYGRGHIVVRAPGPSGSGPSGEFDVSLVIDLEDYVLGISEMPYFWGLSKHDAQEALRAQVVAARSYALVRQLSRGAPDDNSCNA